MDILETNCDDWREVNCRHCKYSKYTETFHNKKSVIQSECKRIDHNYIRFAKPFFSDMIAAGGLHIVVLILNLVQGIRGYIITGMR